MAQASQKKLAQANTAALQQLHTVTAAILSVVVVLQWLIGRSIKKTILFSVPMLFFQYFLEKSGRPKYNGRELKSSGSDLSQSGLTEYMHDVIYFTWILLVLSLISMKFWYLFILVPLAALYKAFQLLKAGKQLLGGGQAAAPVQADPQQAPQAQEQPQAPSNRRERRKRV